MRISVGSKILSAAAFAAALSGCQGTSLSGSGAAPASGLTPPLRAATIHGFLYATTLDWNSGTGSIYAYKAYGNDTSPVRTRSTSTGFPDGVWTDVAGNVYVAVVNAGTNGHGYINVYAPGLRKLLRTYTSGLDGPSGGTFDAAGTMYVANLCGPSPSLGCYVFAKPERSPHGKLSRSSPYTGYVAIYPPGSKKPATELQGPINIAVNVAVDRAGNVFVVNNTGASAWDVVKFAPGSTAGSIVRFKGLSNQLWIGADTFDAKGALVISANAAIDFFLHEKGRASHSLTDGVFAADGLAFGPDGTLFAGNYEFEQNEGNIVAFPPGANQPQRSYAVPYGNGVVSVAVGSP